MCPVHSSLYGRPAGAWLPSVHIIATPHLVKNHPLLEIQLARFTAEHIHIKVFQCSVIRHTTDLWICFSFIWVSLWSQNDSKET